MSLSTKNVDPVNIIRLSILAREVEKNVQHDPKGQARKVRRFVVGVELGNILQNSLERVRHAVHLHGDI